MVAKQKIRSTDQDQVTARTRISQLEDRLKKERSRDRVGDITERIRRAEEVYANRFAVLWIVMEEWSDVSEARAGPGRSEPVSLLTLGAAAHMEAFFSSGGLRSENDGFCGVRLRTDDQDVPTGVTLRFPAMAQRLHVPHDFSVELTVGQSFAFSLDGTLESLPAERLLSAYYVFTCLATKAEVRRHCRRF